MPSACSTRSSGGFESCMRQLVRWGDVLPSPPSSFAVPWWRVAHIPHSLCLSRWCLAGRAYSSCGCGFAVLA